MNLFKEIEPKEKNWINVVIEIPSGGRNKIEYSKKRGYFYLDRSLYSAVYYPFEYGFIPQTSAEDGDPLDVVLLTTHPTFSGCIIRARPIGVLLMNDEKGKDHKIIAVPLKKIDPRFEDINKVQDLAKHIKMELTQFMLDYKKLEETKKVKIRGWSGNKQAKKIIENAIKKYQVRKCTN
ncbi:inorganic diphosphatase [archaeon]|nr:inorganic diphosphatase [archaeon]